MRCADPLLPDSPARLELEDVSTGYAGVPALQHVTMQVPHGARLAIVGPNGSGKTTLLRVLLGELEPQKGRIRLGAGLQVAYFDQLRAQLDETRSLKDNVAGGGDTVSVGGTTRHVVGYLRDFLFASEQILAPVRVLSGGERNRLLLAKLFCVPSNVLVLDEPTNDLDLETLSLLEEMLLDYSGTILLVSHDRTFLNNVVTSTLVFEDDGRLREYVGGYDDWLRQRREPAKSDEPRASKRAARVAARPAEKRKLSYKESRELERLPQRIEALEKEETEIIASLSSSAFYAAGEPTQVTSAQARLEALHLELDKAYSRWQELEDLEG